MSRGEKADAGGAGASRRPAGGSSFTTLSPVYETRQLKIAYGIQFHPHGESLPVSHHEYLDKYLELSDKLEKISDTEYLNHLQRVRFTIEETTSKQKFIEWLKTPELHVIYMGHARHGRGPCFGAHGVDSRGSLVKTQDWEQGTDDDSGIFRMGYPFIGVEVSELVGHGYMANAVKESEGRPPRADCDPYLRGYLGSLRALAPNDIGAGQGLAAQFRNHKEGDRYWTFQSSLGIAIIHHAGWQSTLSPSSELGILHDPKHPDKSQMKCRVFSHLGCTTFVHNYPVVRWIAKWKLSGNERYAHWTSDLSAPHAVGPWVHAVISYDKFNAFKPWGPSLKWAVQRANRSLRAMKAKYKIV